MELRHTKCYPSAQYFTELRFSFQGLIEVEGTMEGRHSFVGLGTHMSQQ